jgi:hypothetical protein
VLESSGDDLTAKRVELFAKAKERVFGILRTFFIAYSFENSILQLGEASNDVVLVRAIGSNEGSPCILQDYLILKRNCIEGQQPKASPYHVSIPDIFVSALWNEKMGLKMGDKVVLSKPLGEYSIAPPSVSKG